VRLDLPRAIVTVSLHGRVIDAAGNAVEGAKVELAYLRAASDARGGFRFELDVELLRMIAEHYRTLAVIAADGRFARVALKVDNPGPYVLQLPDEMQRIAGQLVDATGAPLEGVRVVLYDGTRTNTAKTLEAPDGAQTPGRGVTDSAGRFRFERLLQRPYTLRFMAEDPFLVLDARDVAAGAQHLVVQVPDDHLWPRVAGRAVDQTGNPLPTIRVSITAYESVPGAVRSFLTGPTALTDKAGHFELRGVPRREVSLDFDAHADDGFNGFSVPIEALDAPEVGDVSVDVNCDVFARLVEGFIGGQVRFVDAAGAPLHVRRVMAFGTSYELLVRQEGDGTFGQLYVPQSAAAAEVLDRDGRTLRLVALTPSPLERNPLEL